MSLLRRADPYAITTRALARSVAPLTDAVLDLPTFDDDPNVSHVSVVTIPEGFAGYRYWMAHTPYPSSSREDPHICASNDNVTWETPTGAPVRIYTNADAIADYGAGYNSDTELVAPPSGGLACYWRVAGGGEETIVRKTTSDGRTWSTVETILDNPSTTNLDRLLSPSIVIDDDGTWNMWTVYGDDATDRIVEHRTSADGVTWGAATSCTLPDTGAAATNINPWHIAVRRVGSTYYMLLTGDVNRSLASNFGKDLYYWTSTDKTTWTGSSTPIVPVQDGFERYYRSHFEPMPGQPLKWNLYLANVDESPTDVWRISVHEGVDLSFGHHQAVRAVLDDLEAEQDFWYIPAEQMKASGTTLTQIGSYVPALSFPDGGYNWGLATIHVPNEWGSFQARVIWANAGAAAGDVEWRVVSRFWRDGDDLTTGSLGGSDDVVSTAGTQDVLVRTSWSASITANDSGSGDADQRPNLMVVGVQRRGGDAEDTLSNAANLIGVELRKAS